jgi:hypothetical protein
MSTGRKTLACMLEKTVHQGLKTMINRVIELAGKTVLQSPEQLGGGREGPEIIFFRRGSPHPYSGNPTRNYDRNGPFANE